MHQASHVHLSSSLLRIPAVEESPKLPDEVKTPIPKKDLSGDEKAALHNVTSALYNRPEIRRIVDAAVKAICEALEVRVPEKKGKGKDKSKKNTERDGERASKDQDRTAPVPQKDRRTEKNDATVPKKSRGEEAPTGVGRTDQDLDENEQELAVSRFEDMLGSSSEDEDGSSDGEGESKSGQDRTGEKDPMEISSGEEEGEDGYDSIGLDDEDEDEDEDDEDDSSDESASGKEAVPNRIADSIEEQDESGESSDDSDESDAVENSPPRKKAAIPSRSRPGDSVFLPSLMGGYISGSESASDIDIAPPKRKNRRGQQARQAIWEKKYKDTAKHLKDGATTWDPKRGAVSANDKQRKRGAQRSSEVQEFIQKKKPKVDEGPLHPSWEARRKTKEMEKAKFAGTKMTFD